MNERETPRNRSEEPQCEYAILAGTSVKCFVKDENWGAIGFCQCSLVQFLACEHWPSQWDRDEGRLR